MLFNKSNSRSVWLPACLATTLLCCCLKSPTPSRVAADKLPHTILWAWERPEDLEFLDATRYGVAFLAQTLILQDADVTLRPRRQPLHVNPQTKLIAVTRIESQKITGKRAELSAAQRQKIVSLVMETHDLPNVSAIQLDYDVASSEREFYGVLLKELRHSLPADVPLSITALASFCLGDRWLADLPVDEAVPMIFRMGADDTAIKNSLSNGNDFREPLCRHSYGIAVDEPFDMKMDPARRLYVFANHSWSEKDLATLSEKFSR